MGPGASPSILRIANHTLVRCETGSLEVEATLFPAGVGVRVTTSAGEARARLARSGLTKQFATQALASIKPVVLASYARADCVRAVIAQLAACEVFAGCAYDPDTQSYEGAWLDLRAFAADLRVQGAGLVLQGLYLVSVLDELSPGTPISLENGGDGKGARLAFLKPHSLLGALGQITPRAQQRRESDEKVRNELARSLRDHATVSTAPSRARHLAVEQALAGLDKPMRGRLADIDLWTIARQLEAGDIRGALERIQNYVRSQGGENAATRFLRAHLALVEGSEPARSIAEGIVEEGPPFYELELLKARAWMAAGVWAYAHHFARALVDDPNVSDAVSLAALEIVDAVASEIGRGTPLPTAPWDAAPPSTKRLHSQSSLGAASIRRQQEASAGSILASPIFMVVANPVELPPSVEAVPSSLNLPMELEDPISAEPPTSEDAPPTQVDITQEVAMEHLEMEQPEPSEPPTQIFLAARARPSSYDPHPYANAQPQTGTHAAQGEVYFAEPVSDSTPIPRPYIPFERGHMTDRPPPAQAMALAMRPIVSARYIPEEVESLALPPGLHDSQLPEGMAARNADEVRIVSTRFSRLIGREYREKYGVQLRTDATAVEFMQKHLLKRWGHTGVTGPEATWDVRRHGALLSEILARTLGAAWVDVSPTEIGYWAMFVPPRTRTWPFGRVHRFLSLGHREKDLVSYYLDLVARAREV